MRLLKPSWVSHDGHPIFSLDIHPDGTRFATGGQGDDSGRIVLWNMDPVAKEDEERNANVPKMLCQMDNHLACVNCVRWSNNGKYLASGGDDKVIMIWQTGRYSGSSSVFGGGGKVNVEQWRSASTLRGHSGDILDLAWSSHDAWLASCSVDNTVVVWNATKFPEILSVLRGHSGLVKGVSWDPVGKYLASQSDDKTLQVWRTLDWQQEVVITEPFEECGGTTHVLRLSWSPDGQFLVSAHAMNNSGPTAQIIERDGWKTEKDFVGHRKAITVAKFNPNILSKVNKENSKVQQYCCCAIGSRDRSLSIWLTSLKRPLVVIHDLFANSISDVSWSRNGYQLMVCSWDGTVAYVDFSEEEIGHPLSLEEQSLFHQKKYGKSLAMANHTGSVTTIIENPEMLKLKEQEKEKEQANQNKQQEQHKATIAAKGPINKQIETRTADGRRRITPMFIAPAPDLGDVPLPFNSKSQPTFSSSTESKSKIIIEKRDEVVVTSNTRNSLDSSSPQSSRLDSNQASSGVTLAPIPTGASSVPHNALAGSSDIAKASAIPTTPLNSTSDTLKPLSVEKPKESFDKITDKTKDPKLKLSEPILPIKRKVEEIVKPVKRRPGRPPLAEKLASIAAASAAVEKEPKEVPRTAPDHSSRIHLPALKAEKYISIQIIGEKSESPLVMEVENSIAAASNIFVHRLKCVKSNSTLWEVLLPDKINAVTGNSYLVGVFCEDNTLSVFTLMGRRMFPALVLPGPVARLTCNGFYLMAITTKAHVFVWDTRKADIVIKNESLHPIMSGGTSDLSITSSSLTDHGCPIISLSTGKSFVFSNTLSSWMMVSNVEDAIQYCSDHQLCLPSMAHVNGTLLPLASLQSQGKRPSHVATRLFRNTPSMQQAGTLSYLDTQLASSLALHSGKEFKFWLLTLVRYLILEGLENRLRDICNDLLGPITKSKYTSWEPYILGLHKRDLLQEILPMIGSNLRLQRLFTEYQEQLEMTKK